jgi:cellulose synthase/poly-beta-1,6-N-acetylglucosamine synthase-like glycosyltransferase
MEQAVLISAFLALCVLFAFGTQGLWLISYYNKARKQGTIAPPENFEYPLVTIQLPIYNELYVIDRLIDSICELDYPKEKMQIQVLDDSTDETVQLVARLVAEKQKAGFDIVHAHRTNRSGFKAGALKEALPMASGEFVAIFDADFVPEKDFLQKTIPHFFKSPKIGMVQTRWEHLNSEYSVLTRAQAIALDGHFAIEQQVRNHAGFFINFNGTAGVWRKSCIEDAGNWQDDTLTEDLDLSYRAQLRGWQFIYLNDVTTPAELPSEINALKSQQFRWTKGAIQCAKKTLPSVWKAKIPLRIKLQATVHLSSNIVFPFILLTALFNVPLVLIKNNGGNHDTYFTIMAVFVLSSISSFLFYLYAQKDIHADWQRRIFLFPVFMAGSMGFAVNNTRAVIEGLIGRKSEFTRTPKYKITDKKDGWKGKKYSATKVDWTIIVEVFLTLYFVFGVAASVYYLEIAAIPFQLMFLGGFGCVAYMSLKHAFLSRVRA